jgi:hypothetical protein
MTMLVLMLAALACGAPSTPIPTDSGPLETSPPATPIPTEGGPLETSPPATAPPTMPPGSTPIPSEPPPPPCIQASVLTIAYTNNGNLWLIEGTNPPLQLTSGGTADTVAISEDGLKVAFTTYDLATQNTELRVVNSDGTGEMVLLSQPELDALYPLSGALHNHVYRYQFKPCSQSVYFNTRASFEGPGLATHDGLLEIDVNTGIVTTLLASGDGGDFYVSPDGNRIAISRPESVSFADADGTNLVPNTHTFTPVITYSEFRWSPPLQWAPDSSAVGLAMPSEDPFLPGAYGEIWQIPADGSPASLMATITAKFYHTQTQDVAISPDLSKLVYTRESGTPSILDLYFANIDGSGESLYDTHEIRPQGWAPDSTNYAYVVNLPMGAELRIGKAGFPPMVQTATTDIFRNVAWVDNTRLLFFEGSHPNWDLYLGVLGGGNTLLASVSGDFIPSFDITPKP